MDLLEILLPILFAVGYFIVAAMKGGKKEENPAPGPQREAEAEEADLSGRERQIQEEIRRKIMERTRRDAGAENPPITAEAETSPRYDPTRSEADQRRRQVREQVKRVEEPPPVPGQSSRWAGQRRSSRDAYEKQEPPPLQPAMQRREDDFQERMRAQQEEIDGMQRRAEEIRKRASRQTEEVSSQLITPIRDGSRRRNYSRGTGSFQADVINALKDPRGFKKAVLSYEILGTPVGLRKQDKIGPLWQQ